MRFDTFFSLERITVAALLVGWVGRWAFVVPGSFDFIILGWLCLAGLALYVRRKTPKARFALPVLLAVLIGFNLVANDARPIVWGERAVQFATLFVFALASQSAFQADRLARSAIALTFLSHGILALGVFEPPPSFYTLIATILNIEGDAADLLLRGIGILDLCAAVGIWIPNFKVMRICLLYVVFWGCLTAGARVLVPFMSAEHDVLGGIFEMLRRLPNGLLALWLLRRVNRKREQPKP